MTQRNVTRKVKWMPLPRTEKAEALSNPYCGLYSLYRFYADSEMLLQANFLIEEVTTEPAQQLCLIEINLVHFNETVLSEASLTIIRRIFRHFSSERKQMIVRFVYDWEGKGIMNEPKDIAVILKHMEQLAPLLKEYTDSIYILQGLFIGSWGEMHNSRFLSEWNMARLAKQLYESCGENTQIALRCPSFWRMICKTSVPFDAASGIHNTQKERFSLFNDGIMASDSDFGTYGEIFAKASKKHADKWVRRDELDFQNKLCRFVSNGGEVIQEGPLNDATVAIETLKVMRVSYLHCNYDQKVLDKWKSSPSGITDALWKDKTSYEYIAAHLGYRFTIEEVIVMPKAHNSGILKVSIQLINAGFAPCYHQFEVKIVVRTASFSETYEYKVDTDTSLWMPEELIELEALIDTAGLEQKNYILCFGIYDTRTKQPIQIANTFSAADYTGLYNLGNLSFNH